MDNTMEYKGYIGSVEISEGNTLLYGKVIGACTLISYEGKNAKDLISNFHTAVDDYLKMCAAKNIKPETAYKGSFTVRISPEMHKQAVVTASALNISLNKFVEHSIQNFLVENLIYRSMA